MDSGLRIRQNPQALRSHCTPGPPLQPEGGLGLEPQRQGPCRGWGPPYPERVPKGPVQGTLLLPRLGFLGNGPSASCRDHPLPHLHLQRALLSRGWATAQPETPSAPLRAGAPGPGIQGAEDRRNGSWGLRMSTAELFECGHRGFQHLWRGGVAPSEPGPLLSAQPALHPLHRQDGLQATPQGWQGAWGGRVCRQGTRGPQRGPRLPTPSALTLRLLRRSSRGPLMRRLCFL